MVHSLTAEQRRWRAKDAKLKRLVRRVSDLSEHLREADRILSMVPADREPVAGYLREFHQTYVYPFITKIRKL